mmetsp:Transcript_8358/g.19000  ORF Transcript_8358/g.19000 Transcript_8358/m.19000 type:complete len:81 (+) Transcript_8358:1027-1269(+)
MARAADSRLVEQGRGSFQVQRPEISRAPPSTFLLLALTSRCCKNASLASETGEVWMTADKCIDKAMCGLRRSKEEEEQHA